jgi:hypothetical protein
LKSLLVEVSETRNRAFKRLHIAACLTIWIVLFSVPLVCKTVLPRRKVRVYEQDADIRAMRPANKIVDVILSECAEAESYQINATRFC